MTHVTTKVIKYRLHVSMQYLTHALSFIQDDWYEGYFIPKGILILEVSWIELTDAYIGCYVIANVWCVV